MPMLKLGSIYSINYMQWKTNPTRIYIFVLWGNPVTPKIHALNLGARQLTTVDRAKLVHTIVRLSKVPNASIYSGKLLYRIFLTYLKPQISKCYRTYFHSFVAQATLLNYGVNKKEDFSESDLKIYDKQLHLNAQRDYLIRLLNMYSRRGVELKQVQARLATIETKITPVSGQPAGKVSQTDANTKPGTTAPPEPEKPVEAPTEKPENETPPEGSGGDLGGIGY